MKPERIVWALLILFATSGSLTAGPSEQFVYDLRG